MRVLLLILCGLIFVQPVFTQNLFQPIGQWREHLPYNSAIDVAAGNGKIYCATPYSLFTIDLEENSIERKSKISGLSETGISTIQFDEISEQLFIAYSNSNIDIIYRNDIINIPDIKRDGISGDKTIYQVFKKGDSYYLSTGLGVIVVDGHRHEIRDSWFIGNNGGQVRVNGFIADAGFFYAATEQGLKRTQLAGVNHADHNNWQLLSGTNGLPAGASKNVMLFNNKIITLVNDSLFALSATGWDFFYADDWPVINANVSDNKLLLSQRRSNGDSRVILLEITGTISKVLQQPGVISSPQKAIQFQNETWIADQFGGLSRFDDASFEVYKPASPEATASGEMIVHNGIFYATAGEVNDSWNYQFNGNGIYRFAEGQWTNFNRYRIPELDSLFDFITVAVSNDGTKVWAGSYGGGLLRISEGNDFEIFKQNSPIGATAGDPGSYRVSGLAFDETGNLWISNFGAAQNFHVLKADGTWKSFSPPFGLFGNALSQVLVDVLDQKWIVSPMGNGLIVFNHGNSIDDAADDQWRIFKTGATGGNLPSNDVLSVAEDANGFIWVGTSDGLAVIQCPQEVFSPGSCPAVWPVVEQDGFSSYLFKGQEVRSIAVDGADRKWVATKTGVSLVSSGGDKLIYHFTEDNSPLLSSDVKKIAIDGRTGEVFFATLKGICSFRSTATDARESKQELLVFPNPVPPGYAGTIAIRGLVNNAIVKITELDGRLVYQTRALGGQATWDGRDYRGRRVGSGVYLVIVTDDARTEKAAGRIIFISK